MTDDQKIENGISDGLADPDDRPDYANELSPSLLADGTQQGKKEDV